jgi:hypothetical protein
MDKKPISNSDLSWIILEELRDSGDCPVGVSIALISLGKGQWRVIVEANSRKHMTPNCMKQLAAIARKFRRVYALVD